jgi:hypothetical protein
MFSICPECSNDKLKIKVHEKREYDPATTRTTINEEIAVTEYFCHECGWNALVEDDAYGEEMMAHRDESNAGRPGKLAGMRRGEGQ